MIKTTEILIDHGLADKVFTIEEFKRIFPGTVASQYGLLNKALAKGQIVQLRRGVYLVNQKYNPKPLSRYYLASQIRTHSYVSMESALSFHGWIPEQVTVVSSVINNGRSEIFTNPMGEFQYYRIPTQPYQFLTGVQRGVIDKQPFLMASGLRALLDLIYQQKIDWQGLDFVENSLRIEIDSLRSVDIAEYHELLTAYRAKRVLKLLNNLMRELKQ